MRLSHQRTGTGEPLVLIHGIGSRWQMWEPVMPALSATHDVIALDLPGFGASAMPPPGTAPGLPSLTALVTGFLADLGIQSPHVAGNSLGGLVALELARRGVARSCVALSPAGFASPAETSLARASLWAGVRAARWLEPRAAPLLSRPGLRRLALRQYMEHGERMSVADAVGSVRALAMAPWFDATLAALRGMRFPRDAGIGVPVTIAWGEHDRLLLARQAHRAALAIPAARLVTLRGCGHLPTYDDPPQVARVLLEGAAARV